MAPSARASHSRPWKPVPDSETRFSSGSPDLDRLLGGGFQRGSFVLLRTDASAGTEELHRVLTPLWLNFLRQSHGILAVLPARESPHRFREALLRHVSRRLFDSRVRIVDYVGEDDEASYVVSLKGLTSTQLPEERRKEAIERITRAERIVRGAGPKPFLEVTSLEILEAIAGVETATRMYLHGMKRTRSVGNLGIAIARPGLACFDAVRAMVDYELALRVEPVGLILSGTRPSFTDRLVVPDRLDGPPHIVLVPSTVTPGRNPPSPRTSTPAA